ncbi:MAG: hydroxymethylbilane synthase [Alphaproteobacteria bacterium]|nr:hydroxymethylbilane synthase [Alphaproteobacteria bacterium]
MSRLIRIGTRASKLARAQAQMVAEALQTLNPTLAIATVAMTTAGDRELHKQLSDWGYKGLFTKELEDALLADSIDIAVHSMKDMPSILPAGLTLAAMLPRADVRDAWISPHYATPGEVPEGATVGTSSARRAAQLLHRRPDLQVVPLRGNVETRLRKLDEGVAVATFLASAGLMRLGLTQHIRHAIAPEEMLPAVAQGAIGIECRTDNADMRALLARINHAPTLTCLTAERAFLEVLDGSCRTPIAGLATLDGDQIHLRGEVLSLDGTLRHFDEARGNAAQAHALGEALGHRLRAQAKEALQRHD